MKSLPEKIPMGAVMFADGANGYRLQTFENKEFGIVVSKIKPSHNKSWEQVWIIHSILDKSFASYQELKDAVVSRDTNRQKEEAQIRSTSPRTLRELRKTESAETDAGLVIRRRIRTRPSGSKGKK